MESNDWNECDYAVSFCWKAADWLVFIGQYHHQWLIWGNHEHAMHYVWNVWLTNYEQIQSSLYTAYTKTTSKEIDTLRELDKSGLKITVESPLLRRTFGNWEDASNLFRSLKAKVFLESYAEKSGIERVAENRDVCSLERYSDVNIIIKVWLFALMRNCYAFFSRFGANLLIKSQNLLNNQNLGQFQTKYLNKDGSPKLHVIKDCPRHYFLTYIVYRDWPMLYRFNKILHHLAEAGLLIEIITKLSEFCSKTCFKLSDCFNQF